MQFGVGQKREELLGGGEKADLWWEWELQPMLILGVRLDNSEVNSVFKVDAVYRLLKPSEKWTSPGVMPRAVV